MRTPLPALAVLLLPAIAAAQNDSEPQLLPTLSGRVAQFSLTPNGDVDGLILADGTEIHLPPHLGPRLVEAIRPGDEILARGLPARAIPMMDAVSVTDVTSGQTVTDTGAPPPPGPPPLAAGPGTGPGLSPPGSAKPRETAAEHVSLSGTVRMRLHGPKGDTNGVLLEDGTIIRFPPGSRFRGADQLRPGQPITVSGRAITGPTGRVLAADRFGPDAGRLPPSRREPAPSNGAPHP